jgi:hypothetical protein
MSGVLTNPPKIAREIAKPPMVSPPGTKRRAVSACLPPTCACGELLAARWRRRGVLDLVIEAGVRDLGLDTDDMRGKLAALAAAHGRQLRKVVASPASPEPI